jgi:hypothetical protein
MPLFGGGVSSSESDCGPNAFTRAIVGVLSGRRFNGGRRKGMRSFFLRLEEEPLDSKHCIPPPELMLPTVIPRFLRVSLSVLRAFSDFSLLSCLSRVSGPAGFSRAPDFAELS